MTAASVVRTAEELLLEVGVVVTGAVEGSEFADIVANEKLVSCQNICAGVCNINKFGNNIKAHKY